MDIPELIVLATENPGKASELSAYLSSHCRQPVQVVSLKAVHPGATLPEEVGGSFCEIAAAKAVYAAQLTGLPSMGDDSGLCVDGLNGEPGTLSRRWVDAPDDEARNLALLRAMRDLAESAREAQFVSCVALAAPGLLTVVAEGVCRGMIVQEPRGHGGFGYDPLFEAAELGKTFAELTLDEKNSVSHRARALNRLITLLSWQPV